VAKKALKNIREFLGFVDISYSELIPELQHWHTVLIQGCLHDKSFQKILKQSKSFGQGYTIRNGILYFTMDNQVRLCIPDSTDCNVYIKNGLLDKIHQSLGHVSYSKTYYTRASHFYWPNMANDTFEYCRTCGICQLTKQSTQCPFRLPKSLPILARPFTRISIDFLFLPQVTNKTTEVSYDYVWVIVDRFSTYTIILALLLNYTAEHLINVYNNSIYPFFGLLRDIVIDKDLLFTSLAWKKFCIVNNITQSMSSAYYPKTDAQSELPIGLS